MNGLRELTRRNEVEARTETVRRHRRNTIEWVTRARKALEAGEYETARNQLLGAAREVEALIPVPQRAVA